MEISVCLERSRNFLGGGPKIYGSCFDYQVLFQNVNPSICKKKPLCPLFIKIIQDFFKKAQLGFLIRL